MKKNYIYFVAPLVGLVVFSTVYWKYSAGADERAAEIKKIEQKKNQDKLDLEAADRLKAANDAKKAQDDRKAQKAAADKKKAEDDIRHDQAVQARNKAVHEADKLTAQVKRLKKDIDDETKEIAALQESMKHSVAEQTFLVDYVKKSQDNKASLLAQLDKIAEADKAWEAAAREAARAKKPQ